jgi:hypothetical protein
MDNLIKTRASKKPVIIKDKKYYEKREKNTKIARAWRIKKKIEEIETKIEIERLKKENEKQKIEIERLKRENEFIINSHFNFFFN